MRNIGLATARSILKEIRFMAKETGSKNVLPWRHVSVYDDVVDEFKNIKESRNQNDIENSLSTAKAYLCYLQAIRRSEELDTLYKGHGESSIEDSAARVGLKLPKTYRE